MNSIKTFKFLAFELDIDIYFFNFVVYISLRYTLNYKCPQIHDYLFQIVLLLYKQLGLDDTHVHVARSHEFQGAGSLDICNITW